MKLEMDDNTALVSVFVTIIIAVAITIIFLQAQAYSLDRVYIKAGYTRAYPPSTGMLTWIKP